MRIMVHVDRLVVDGFALNSAEGAQILAATQTELTRLLASSPIPARLRLSEVVPSISAPAALLPTAKSPQAIGTHIARAIHVGLGGAEHCVGGAGGKVGPQ